jgi:autotransporter-associated beta strand protein
MKKSTIAKFMAISAAAHLSATSAHATALTIQNYSFENTANSGPLNNVYQTVHYGNPGMSIYAWTTVTTGNAANGTYLVNNPAGYPDGVQGLAATMWYGTSTATTTYSGASIGVFASNRTYLLRMAVAETNHQPGSFTLNLLDNGSVIASRTVSLNGAGWQDLTVSASSGYTVGDQIGISFVFDNTGAAGSGTQFNADNVLLDVASPQTWAANVNSNWDTSTANWSGAVWSNGNDAVFGSIGVGTVTLGAGGTANSLTFNTAGYILTGGTLGLTGDAAITANAGATISAGISGSLGLIFSGTGTLVLTGSNSYTGATSINAGTLWFGVNHNLLGAVTLANVAGAGLLLNYNNSLPGLAVGSLSGGGANGGNVDLRGDTLTVGGDNTSTTYSGQIASSTGGGNLVKTGTGTLTLSGPATYAGTTTVSQGTLAMGGTAGTASVTVASGAGLGNVGQLTLTGNLVLSGSSSLNLNLGSPVGSDGIRLTGGYSGPGSPVKININAMSGFGTGTYTLITGASGISAGSFVLNSVPPGYTLALSASNGTLTLTCTQYPAIRILPLGDSITWGVGGDTDKGGYRGTLYNLLTALGYNAIFVGNNVENSALLAQPHHEGHPGQVISYITANIAAWLATMDNPDVVLLHIGTNDIGISDFPNAINRLDDLITQIATLRPYAHIIVTTLMQRSGDTLIPTYFNPYVQGKVNAQAALGRRVTFLDMWSAVPYPANMADGVHPNQPGYNLMAAAWLGAIQAVWAPQGDLTKPAAPGGLAAAGGNAQVALTWSASVGATGYNVKRSTVSGSNYSVIAANTAAVSYTDTGAANWMTYYYVVSAVNPGGEGVNSAQASAQPQSPPISAAEKSASSKISLSGSAGTVAFKSSVLGHTYQLQTIDSLTSGTWTNVGTAQPGTGADLIFVAPYDSSVPGRFYRLQIRQ